MLNFKHINRSIGVNKTGYVLKVKLVLKYFSGWWWNTRNLIFFFLSIKIHNYLNIAYFEARWRFSVNAPIKWNNYLGNTANAALNVGFFS